jgi:AAA family ATPase
MKALMRPGRLDRIVYVRMPDEDTRQEIFEMKLRNVPTSNDINIKELVNKTKKYSGAEIAAICNEAAIHALDDNIDCQQLEMKHFEMALQMIAPRISDETIRYFDNFSFQTTLHEI